MKKNIDMPLAIIFVFWVVVLVGSVVFNFLKMISLLWAILIPVIYLAIPTIYIIIKVINKKSSVNTAKSRPELDDIIPALESWKFVKTYFQQNFGILVTLNHDRAYHKIKTVGSDNYETKIYSLYVKQQENPDYFHVVHIGHNPDGLLFIRNEDNPERIRELEEGLAVKSQLFRTETTIQRDDLSGREIKKVVTSPVEEKKDVDDDEDDDEEEK